MGNEIDNAVDARERELLKRIAELEEQNEALRKMVTDDLLMNTSKRAALEAALERQHTNYCHSVRTALRRVGVERPNTECHGPLVADLCAVARDAKARAEKAEGALAKYKAHYEKCPLMAGTHDVEDLYEDKEDGKDE